MDLLFLVGKLEELGVGCVQLFLREVVAEQFEPVYERRAAAARSGTGLRRPLPGR